MIQHIRTAGDHVRIGLDHGQSAAGKIRRNVDFYREFISTLTPEADGRLVQLAQHFGEVIKANAPLMAQEIEAIAEGAGLAPHWLYMLNARSEILAQTLPECTSVFSPESGVLAQNWDFSPNMQDATVLLDIEFEDGLKVMTVTEAGMVGKIGMNSRGVGVCLNMLHTERNVTGEPIHVLLRTLMQAGDIAAVRERISQAGTRRSGNVLVGTAYDGGLNIEYLGSRMRQSEVAGKPFVHTNHPLDEPLREEDIFQNSFHRYETAKAITADGGALDVVQADRLLSDQSHPEHPVCAPFRNRDGFEFGTVLTVVMELRTGRLHLREGPEPDAAYTTFELDPNLAEVQAQ